MDSTGWDARYASSELVWSTGPNRWVEEVCAELEPGTAVDLAAGEGRNALWLAERGWEATAVDFSAVGLDRARRLAAERLGENASRLHTVQADLASWSPHTEYDLALVVYLQVPSALRRTVLVAAATAVAPGGRVVVVAHHSDNLTAGVGGPQDPAVLYSEQDVLDDVAEQIGAIPLRVERAERALRTVGDRQAVDVVVVLHRD
ncbi:MAG: methyltransferase domain-containing protein [Kineosporiaceae bacterium]|nr:methyltransferase domain-containing protein [Kineosporiaceae bacterium]